MLKKSLKKLLTKYKNIADIIIFGSFVKDKFNPKDIDIAIISREKDLAFIGEISSELPEKTHLEVLFPEQIYKTKLGLAIISEGFSVKENRFLREMVGIKPQKIYSYDLGGLTQSEKRQFNRALKKHLAETKGERLGAGSVMIPIEKTGFFENFLDAWHLKLKARNYSGW